jgi:hypothetical protein
MKNKVLTRAVELVTGGKAKVLKEQFLEVGNVHTNLVRTSANPLKEIKDPKSLLYETNKMLSSIVKDFAREKAKVYTTRGALVTGAGVGVYKLTEKKAELVFEKIASGKKHDWDKSLKSLGAGAIAGIGSATVIAPIDLVKSQHKNFPEKYLVKDRKGKTKIMGIGKSLKKMLAEKGGGIKGLKRLWTGNKATVVKLGLGNAVAFTLFGAAYNQLNKLSKK